MILVWRYLCFIIFLQSVSCNTDNDIILDVISSRLDHISISLARIARKQRVMETRIDSITDNMKGRDLTDGKKEDVVSDYSDGAAKEELLIMKRAISSEKEYVRNLVESISVDISGRIAAVKTPSDDLDSRIAAVEATSDDLDSRITAVGDKIAAVKATSSNLGNRIQSMEKGMNTVKATSGGLRTRVDSMESSITSLVSAAERRVSFSVQNRPRGNLAILKGETTVKFNHVFYNDGSGYDKTTGIFTVPVSGVYQFIFFVEGWQSKDEFICQAAILMLYVDGSSAETVAIADPRHKNQIIQAGNTYINYFSKGQEVKLSTADYCDEYSIFDFGTTFSGVLLY
ncbi:uncharacterized protein LOC123526475 [Mercenaria mercenaria]|uniref:uncharacterized protein LOC123526475 n=1 Tax=Mercenaria mercenaria TaxID=6596 RepID=UPI00234EB4AB|nr:uncharacterized protein LOC123526475 [Mercenaria mercenaria]